MSDIPFREPGRHTPAKGVHVSMGGPNWVFLTVCTEKRERWLAQASVQRTLHEIWEHKATTWLVSDYLLMPDHLHLFCSPVNVEFSIEKWITFWKSRFAKRHRQPNWKCQSRGWHHCLRTAESYFEKLHYVLLNPVRAGLVEKTEDWPFQGKLHDLIWRE